MKIFLKTLILKYKKKSEIFDIFKVYSFLPGLLSGIFQLLEHYIQSAFENCLFIRLVSKKWCIVAAQLFKANFYLLHRPLTSNLLILSGKTYFQNSNAS